MRVAVAASALVSVASAARKNIAPTPPMGWMSWERFRCETNCTAFPDDCISEKLYLDHARRMVDDGYLAAGYTVISIDDCWSERERDGNHNLVPDKSRFPNGLKSYGDTIHKMGLKFGLYTAESLKTCAGFPGSISTNEQDVAAFASWGVDYLKVDGCAGDIGHKIYEEGYTSMGQALQNSGRDIVYSCSWPAYYDSEGAGGYNETGKKYCYDKMHEIGC